MRITLAELCRTVQRLQLGVDGAELHGALCGYLAGGGRSQPSRWLEDLALQAPEAEDLSVASDAELELLQQLYVEVAEALADPGLGFQPLLADDEQPLDVRCATLSQWCRGFLGGLGMAGVGGAHALSADGGEALEDLYRIGASELTLDGDGEGDEQALAEIVEYVRMAVLLVFSELRRPASAVRRLN